MVKCKVLSWKYFESDKSTTTNIIFSIQKNNQTSNFHLTNEIIAFYGCDKMTADLADTFLNDENNKTISLYYSDFLGWYIEKYRVREIFVCNNPEDVLKIRDKICTGLNKTMLWSGAKNPFTIQGKAGEPIVIDDYHGPEINSMIARDSGKETLNMLFDRVGITLPKYDYYNKNSAMCWETASQIWAENARGEVGISVGDVISGASVFALVELGILKGNQNVVSIVVYDNWPINADGAKKPKTYTRNEFEKMSPMEFVL